MQSSRRYITEIKTRANLQETLEEWKGDRGRLGSDTVKNRAASSLRGNGKCRVKDTEGYDFARCSLQTSPRSSLTVRRLCFKPLFTVDIGGFQDSDDHNLTGVLWHLYSTNGLVNEVGVNTAVSYDYKGS
jgi:hypothetical protein